MPPIGRRAVLKLAVGSAALAALPWTPGRALAAGNAAMTAQDALLSLKFDRSMRTRVAYRGKSLTPFQASEVLLLKDGSAGLRDAMQEAKDLGLVLSTTAGANAEQFN